MRFTLRRALFATTFDNDDDDDNDAGLRNNDEEKNTLVINITMDIRERLFIHMEDKSITIEEGQAFKCIDDFRSLLKDYAIQVCFYLDRNRNEKDRVTIVCGVSSFCL